MGLVVKLRSQIVMKAKKTKADQRRETQRNELFPHVADYQLWQSGLYGWCLMPRTMPLILHAIRGLSKGASAAETYLALWSNCMSESLVEMSAKANLIASAGYEGKTKERTWKQRMLKLEELGFIKIASGKHGDISCVLILNPHLVLKRLHEEQNPYLDETIYNAIVEQIAEFGMKDFSMVPPPVPPLPPLPDDDLLAPQAQHNFLVSRIPVPQ